MNISTGVFERTGSHDITESSFYGLISFFVLLGLGVTAGAAHYAGLIGFSPHLGGMLLLGLALPILGIVIATRTENPSVAFLGYLLITGSFGFMLGPIGNQYSPPFAPVRREWIFLLALWTGALAAYFLIARYWPYPQKVPPAAAAAGFILDTSAVILAFPLLGALLKGRFPGPGFARNHLDQRTPPAPSSSSRLP